MNGFVISRRKVTRRTRSLTVICVCLFLHCDKIRYQLTQLQLPSVLLALVVLGEHPILVLKLLKLAMDYKWTLVEDSALHRMIGTLTLTAQLLSTARPT